MLIMQHFRSIGGRPLQRGLKFFLKDLENYYDEAQALALFKITTNIRLNIAIFASFANLLQR